MKKATFHAIAGLLALGLAFGVNFAQAQAGTLDPTFGKGGTVTANLGITATTLTAFEQSNGNIVIVTGLNKTGFPGIETFALIRYTSSGHCLARRPPRSSLTGTVSRLRPRCSPTATS